MIRRKIQNIIILLFCGYSLYFVLGSFLTPLFAELKIYYWADKLRWLYSHSCHQQPDRSIWLFGYPIALCARCFGFYIGVFVYAIIVVLKRIKLTLKKYIIIFSLFIIDILLNYNGVNTGNFARFSIGILMGILFVDTLFKLLDIKNGEEK